MKSLLPFLITLSTSVTLMTQDAPERVPSTPAEAYGLASAADRDFIRRRSKPGLVITDELFELAREEQVRLARHYSSLFKVDEWTDDHLFYLIKLLLLARQPQRAESIARPYLENVRDWAEIRRGQELMLWILVDQQKWSEAADLARQLLEQEDYSFEIDRHIQSLIKGLKIKDLGQTINIAERRFPKLFELTTRSRESQLLLLAERTEELADMYVEAGEKNKAFSFVGSIINRLARSQSSSAEAKLAEKILAAVAQRLEILDKPAPVIEAEEYIDLSPFEWKDHLGKVIVLDFFSHSCAPCVADLPKLQALQKQYDRSLEVIVVTSYRGYFGDRENISAVEELKALKKLKLQKGISLGFLVGTHSVFESYGIVTLPAMALIDKTGKVRFIKRSPQMHELERMINLLLKEPDLLHSRGTP